MNSVLEAIGEKIGGVFSYQHIRKGEVIGEGEFDNLFIDEGLIYALNSAFGVPVGGADAPLTNFYIGLTLANRPWLGTDKADDSASGGIHTIGQEFELYTEAARPTWAPQALAAPGTIEINDTGFEAVFTIDDLTSMGGTATLYGAFMISTSAKNGSLDVAGSKLIAGSNFTPTPREVQQSDILKVGYILKAQSL